MGLAEAMINYVTYSLLDILTWQGTGDLINRLRTEILRLDSMGRGSPAYLLLEPSAHPKVKRLDSMGRGSPAYLLLEPSAHPKVKRLG